MKEERLYIVGYMASGKTTFGRALARRLGWDFIDLDEQIEVEQGRSIPELMRSVGEPAFRAMESAALKKTSARRKVIVACGGGTPCFGGNMEFMTLHGHTLWLVASPEKMAERIELQAGSRPLAAGKSGPELLAFVKSHLLARQQFYCQAEWRLNSDSLETAEEIERTIDNFLDNRK